MKLIQFLKEAKQVGILYHYTTLPAAFTILRDNRLVGKGSFVSFTRSQNYHKTMFATPKPPYVRLAFDGDKISNNFKTEPVAGSLARIPGHYRPETDESEEIIRAHSIPINSFLIGIDINEDLIENNVLSFVRWGALEREYVAEKTPDHIKELLKEHKLLLGLIKPEFTQMDSQRAYVNYMKELSALEFATPFVNNPRVHNHGVQIGTIEDYPEGMAIESFDLKEAYTQQDLESMDIDTLDQMAFGMKQGLQRIEPHLIQLTFQDDYENAQHDMRNSGMPRKMWAKQVLADGTPVDVRYKDGKLQLWDGYHRWTAAIILDRDLPVDLTIDDNPTRKLLGLNEERLQNPRTGKRFNVYKNPSMMELKGVAEDHPLEDAGWVGSWLVGNDWYVWSYNDALHYDIEKQLGIQNGIPLSIAFNDRKAFVVVTDSSKRTNWHHNPDVADAIRNHPHLGSQFNIEDISYYDEAIVGSWHEEGFNESNPIFMNEKKFHWSEVYRLHMPDGGEDGVLIAWRADWPKNSWVEFRGPDYTQWTGDQKSDFEKVHDSMKGWHTSVLHAGETVDILPTHPDYERIKNAIEKAASEVSESMDSIFESAVNELTGYHATRHDVDEFRPLTHFGSPESAEELFKQNLVTNIGTITGAFQSSTQGLRYNSPYRTYRANIEMKNPAIMFDRRVPHKAMDIVDGMLALYDNAEAIAMYDGATPGNFSGNELQELLDEWNEREMYVDFDDEVERGKQEDQRKKDLIWFLKSHGHDGIKYINQQEGKGTWSYITLNPVKAESRGRS